jgi:hypothetical protein
VNFEQAPVSFYRSQFELLVPVFVLRRALLSPPLAWLYTLPALEQAGLSGVSIYPSAK